MFKFRVREIDEGEFFIGQAGPLPVPIDDESITALNDIYSTRKAAEAVAAVVAAEIAEIIDEMNDSDFNEVDPAFQFGGSDSAWAER